MFPPNESWRPTLHWSTKAGRALERLVAALPRDRPWLFYVFGSAPLQMGLEPTFFSADVDIFTEEDWRELVVRTIESVDLSKEGTRFYVQCVPSRAFRASSMWLRRAYVEEHAGATFCFAHPIDILLGKLHRLAEKDRRAFQLVIDRTGHPTEKELIAELRGLPELFSWGIMPIFNEPTFRENVVRLWPMFFGRSIDVEREILAPAAALLREAYETEDLHAELKNIVQPPPDAGP